MDISASQYNSGGESGWTRYLDQSSLSENYFQRNGEFAGYGGKGSRLEDEEKEDLSMVSDASSGPPHYDNDNDECLYEDWYPCVDSTEESKKNKLKDYAKKQQRSHLDDTASSPVLSFPKKKATSSHIGAVEDALDFSHGFSASRIKGKPKFQKHFNFFGQSLAGKQASQQSGGFREEDRK